MHVQQKMRTVVTAVAPLLLLDCLSPVAAQLSLATCENGFEWMENELLQSPCEVAAYLISPCLSVPAEATVYSLVQGPTVNFYTPPGVNSLAPTACTCNTVLYSMLSACSVCQLESFLAWTVWEQSCTTVYVAQYPTTIPSAISVPTWGFLDVTKANNFSVAAAQAEQEKNNSDVVGNGTVASPIQHATVTGAASISAAGFSTPSGFSFTFPSESFGATASVPLVGQTGLTTTDETTENKKTNVGAIVGGVVGGVGGLLVIGGVVWYWLTHRTPAAPVAADAVAAPPMSEATYSAIPPGSPDPERFGAASSQPQIHEDVVPEAQYAQAPPPMPLYDPDDPSTFAHVFAASHLPSSASPTLAQPTPSPPPASANGNSSYVPTVY